MLWSETSPLCPGDCLSFLDPVLPFYSPWQAWKCPVLSHMSQRSGDFSDVLWWFLTFRHFLITAGLSPSLWCLNHWLWQSQIFLWKKKKNQCNSSHQHKTIWFLVPSLIFSMPVCAEAQDKCHGLVMLLNRNLWPPSSSGWRSKIKVPWRLVSSGGLPPWLIVDSHLLLSVCLHPNLFM